MKDTRVTCAALRSVLADVGQNLALVRQAAEQAKRDGARMLVSLHLLALLAAPGPWRRCCPPAHHDANCLLLARFPLATWQFAPELQLTGHGGHPIMASNAEPLPDGPLCQVQFAAAAVCCCWWLLLLPPHTHPELVALQHERSTILDRQRRSVIVGLHAALPGHCWGARCCITCRRALPCRKSST